MFLMHGQLHENCCSREDVLCSESKLCDLSVKTEDVEPLGLLILEIRSGVCLLEVLFILDLDWSFL